MSDEFEVFISHNSKDKPAVIGLAQRLQAEGVKVWLDVWELRPGHPWQEALEEIIKTTSAAAVLVGADGIGPWENREMQALLDQFVQRKLPVIPVLLPDCPKQTELPLFLHGLTWVDLRGGLNSDGLKKLVWGITGVKPAKGSSKNVYTVGIKMVGNFNYKLIDRLKDFSKTRFIIKYIDIHSCIVKANKIDFILLRSQLEDCNSCIFAFTDEKLFTGINKSLYYYLFVKGIASHFLVPETFHNSFTSSQEYRREKSFNKICQTRAYEDENYLLTGLLDLIQDICPPEYQNLEPFKNIIPDNALEIINYQSSFDNVTQVINSAPTLHDFAKKELSSLIDELKKSLEPALKEKPDKTDLVTHCTQAIADEVAKEKPNKSILQYSCDGLISAAKAVTDVAPLVLGITKKIATFISELPAS